MGLRQFKGRENRHITEETPVAVNPDHLSSSKIAANCIAGITDRYTV
jgi:hypothetical protein